MTSRRVSWIITLSLAALAVVYLKFIWLPGRRAIEEMTREVETKRAFVAEATGVAAARVGVEHELAKADAVVMQWQKAAPRKRNISHLYGKLDDLAKQAHLTTGRFDPQPLVVYERLQELPVSVSCTGTFAQMYAFLRSVESLPETIWIGSMRIEKMATPTQGEQCEINMAIFSDNF